MADDAKTPKKRPRTVSDMPAVETDAVSDDSSLNSKRKRRMLRPAAEISTLREQSEQAQARADRPRHHSRVIRILSTPFVAIGRLLVRIFRPLGRFRLFRIIGYIIVPPYVRNAWRELRLVTWPDRRQTRQLTFAVIVFSLVFGVIAAGVDYGLDKIFRALIINSK